jgi:hypothetical protein
MCILNVKGSEELSRLESPELDGVIIAARGKESTIN